MNPVAVACAVDVPSERLDIEEAILRDAGIELLDRRGRALDEIEAELRSADAVLTEALGRERFDASRVAQLERCRAISVYAVGTDGIDLAEATRRGIVVANVPDYCAVEVAEHTLALILAAWRRLRGAERVARSGDWGLEELRPVHRLRGRTAGLIGFGRIAREVAVRLQAFGAVVVAHDPYADAALAARLDVTLGTLEEVLERSHILSLHAPLTADTAGLIDGPRLALMPPGAVVVNAGRGGLIDHEALLAALESGRLGAAALDVMAAEPVEPAHPLLHRDDVVVTPHMGYYSEESLQDLRAAVAENVVAILSGRLPQAVANPEVATRHKPA